MFETEAMLGPFVDAAQGNAARMTDTDVVGANRRYHSAGLRADLLVIHEGVWVTVLLISRLAVTLSLTASRRFRCANLYVELRERYNGLVELSMRRGIHCRSDDGHAVSCVVLW